MGIDQNQFQPHYGPMTSTDTNLKIMIDFLFGNHDLKIEATKKKSIFFTFFKNLGFA